MKIQAMQPYSGTDTANDWNKSRFVLSDKSDFDMVGNQIIVLPIKLIIFLITKYLSFWMWNIKDNSFGDL